MKKNVKRISESQIRGIVVESVKKILNEGWMEISEINDAYENVLNALYDFEDACGEYKEMVNGYDDRTEPEEFFIPDNDFEQVRMLLKKIKNDVSKSKSRNVGRYKRDNGKLFKMM